jgi:hypothetical protein
MFHSSTALLKILFLSVFGNAVSSLLARAQTHSNCHVGVIEKQIVIFTVKAMGIEGRNWT